VALIRFSKLWAVQQPASAEQTWGGSGGSSSPSFLFALAFSAASAASAAMASLIFFYHASAGTIPRLETMKSNSIFR